MKRVIKFRGKRTTNGEWAFGSLLMQGSGRMCIYDDTQFMREVQPDTVGQFTGLLDACGNEIYEGDILREQGTGKLVQVVYDAPEFVFKSNQFGYVFLNHPENFEVAGNAYDNPELLKGGRE